MYKQRSNGLFAGVGCMACMLFACNGSILVAGPGSPTATSSPPDGSQELPPVAETLRCSQTAETAAAFLDFYCASCHGGGTRNQGGFDYVLDATQLRASGKVTVGDAEGSPLYARPAEGAMPPASAPSFPQAQEVETLRAWIECGAPDFVARAEREYVSVADVTTAIAEDIQQATSNADRQDYRYIVLTNIYNAGIDDGYLEAYRGAVSHLVNSLSRSETVIRPAVLDANRAIFRIRLSDYGWDAALWDTITGIYPYDIRYQLSFGFREDLAEEIRNETGSAVPYVFADWFIENSSVPPLYYALLGVPATLEELEAQLEISIDDNLTGGVVRRAGFNVSGVSVNNRIIERHDIALRENRLGEGLGAFWLAHDFRENTGTSNIFSHPVDFRSAGGEALFDLPNGLQGYIVFDGEGNRLDRASQDIVFDPEARDGAVRPGASCMNCHDAQGVIPQRDEVRSYAELNLDLAERAEVQRLYAEAEEMDGLMASDGARFMEARALAMEVPPGDRPILIATELYLRPLGRADAAALFGLSVDGLEEALNDEELPGAILALRNGLGTIQRDVFEEIFVEVAQRIGLAQSTGSAPPPEPTVPTPEPPAPMPEPPAPTPEPPVGQCAHEALQSAAGVRATASTAGATDDYEGTCGGGGSPDLLFAWTAPADGAYFVSTANSGFDTLLYVRSGVCGEGSELACDNNSSSSGAGASLVFFSAAAGESFSIIVDGDQPTDQGDVVLRIGQR